VLTIVHDPWPPCPDGAGTVGFFRAGKLKNLKNKK